ncbi:MAG TPA: hypothetical protein PLG41_02605 [Leptospiraceae bacterium]|nr:hypothetical protein [Leptospiraceae bacterium]
MKVLIDESLPEQLAKELLEYEVFTVSQMGWKGKKNGELISLIQKEKFHAFITVDKNLRYQQNLENLPFTIIVLFVYRTKMEFIIKFLPEIKLALSNLHKSSIQEIK